MIVVVTVLPRSSINFHTFPRKILNKNKNVSSSAVFQVRQTNLVRLFFRVPFLFIIHVLVSFLYLPIYLSFKMSHLSPGKNSELLQHVGLDVGCTSKPPQPGLKKKTDANASEAHFSGPCSVKGSSIIRERTCCGYV